MMRNLSKLVLPLLTSRWRFLIAQVSQQAGCGDPWLRRTCRDSRGERPLRGGVARLLAKTTAHIADKELQKRVSLDGVRCATVLQQQETLLQFVRLLSRQFPHDPEVLYVLTHAYSDLATRSARSWRIRAPTSIPALEMDADASEQQGKWDQAEKDYRKILEQNPRYPGIHFRLARLHPVQAESAARLCRAGEEGAATGTRNRSRECRRRIRAGRTGAPGPGPARGGQALFQGHRARTQFRRCLPRAGHVAARAKELCRRRRSARKGSQTSTRKSCGTLQPGDRIRAHRTQGRCGAGVRFAAEDFGSRTRTGSPAPQ